jgi:amino acid transporter
MTSAAHTHLAAAPRRVLSTLDGIVLVVGLIVGAGIFRTPPLVAGQAADGWSFLGLWAAGGLVALVGALCYAELASAYPHPGGEYHVLRRAFGGATAFLIGWSRLTVLQTGSIALLAFVFADYAASLLFGAGPAPVAAVPLLAAGAVVVLTLVNAAGLRPGRRTQYLLTTAELAGLSAVIVSGLVVAAGIAAGGAPTPPAPAPAGAGGSAPNVGLALVFVLLTYGGWSEAAYLSAEFRDERRGVRRTLTWGVLVVTVLYLLANAAYLLALGIGGVAGSTAVAVDVVRAAVGVWGGVAVGLVVMVSALSSANATMITGARGGFAVGTDVPALAALGVWTATAPGDGGTPRRALAVQGGVSLVLVALGAATRAGFETLVAYTAPVFWLTLLLMGVALFVLRRREPAGARPFHVPLYPATPLLFCATSAAMLYSSVAYAGPGALLGVAVMLAGVPVLLIGRARARRAAAARASLHTSP